MHAAMQNTHWRPYTVHFPTEGFDCSEVALAVQPTAAAMGIPIVAVDGSGGALSNKKRFVRCNNEVGYL